MARRLCELTDQADSKREQSLQAVGLWLDPAGTPARDGLRRGVEQLGDLA